MTNPQIIEEKVLCLSEVKEAVDSIKERDDELGFLSQKTKEHLDAFVTISTEDKNKLKKALEGLNLTRLKHEHIMKIIDFMPTTDDELKVVLQAYPLTLPKKDKKVILDEVKKIA
jgi:DNA-directed RNA polymerase subunit F